MHPCQLLGQRLELRRLLSLRKRRRVGLGGTQHGVCYASETVAPRKHMSSIQHVRPLPRSGCSRQKRPSSCRRWWKAPVIRSASKQTPRLGVLHCSFRMMHRCKIFGRPTLSLLMILDQHVAGCGICRALINLPLKNNSNSYLAASHHICLPSFAEHSQKCSCAVPVQTPDVSRHQTTLAIGLFPSSKYPSITAPWKFRCRCFLSRLRRLLYRC